LAESTWIPVLLGTRDPDVEAASLAFYAISSKKEAKLNRSQWRMVVYSLKTAQQHVSIKLRHAAASAMVALIPAARVKKIRDELEEVQSAFADDISHSVRSAALMPAVQ
jgi:hypothetical protein